MIIWFLIGHVFGDHLNMKIISHRGLWNEDAEKNSRGSFERSFYEGFGTETDIRDSKGQLVISHDIPSGDEVGLSKFLSLAASNQYNRTLPIALNIKSDGLADTLLKVLQGYSNLDIFVFDMSIPDMRSYLMAGLNVFSRMSEVETTPVWLDQCAGIWLDSFDSDWYSEILVMDLLNSGKRVCIVSPELHGRNYSFLWQTLLPLRECSGLILCTDYPMQARQYFEL